jgi:hypothetical protein
LAKRRTKTRRAVRKKKTNYTLYLMIVVVIVIVILFAYYSNLLGGIAQTSPQGSQGSQPTSTGTELIGGYCNNNQQCFIIGCKSTGSYQCLNTTQMNDFLIHYSDNCKNYVDVEVKVQNLSFCSCINNICTKPK